MPASRGWSWLAPFCFAGLALAQYPGLTLPPSGNNQKASVTQFIGPVKVTIDYSSPAVHGPATPAGGPAVDRRGRIWGQLVPYGLTDLGFGHHKPAPWRGGANENTVFSVSHAVLIEGQPLPAGSYGLHFIVQPTEWTMIFSKNSGAWGSFFYEESEDALRVKVKPAAHAYREYLTYEFPNRKGDEATAELQWEDLGVAWNIKVKDPNEIYFSTIRDQLRSNVGFSYQAWVAGCQFALQTGLHLDEALGWADYAINGAFVGQPNFQTLSNKAQILSKLGRGDEAKPLMRQALDHPATTPIQIHQYGRQLLAENKNAEALEVFQFNAKRFGETWPTHVGLARGYMAVGDKAKALEHARKGLAQAPDPVNRQSLEGMIKALSN